MLLKRRLLPTGTEVWPSTDGEFTLAEPSLKIPLLSVELAGHQHARAAPNAWSMLALHLWKGHGTEATVLPGGWGGLEEQEIPGKATWEGHRHPKE